MHDYLHRQIHNHTRRDRADEIAREYNESSRTRIAAISKGEKPPPGTCKYMMRLGKCTVQGCPHNMIRDGPDFAKANDLAALHREDLVQAKEVKVTVKG